MEPTNYVTLVYTYEARILQNPVSDTDTPRYSRIRTHKVSKLIILI